MFDPILLLIAVILFLAALGASYWALTRTDRCLQDFDGYPVILEKQSGRLVSGKLRLTPDGFELLYPDGAAQREVSYLVYNAELEDIQAIYRPLDALSPQQVEARRRMLQGTVRPSRTQRMRRQLGNFVDTAVSDALDWLVFILTGSTRERRDDPLSRASREHLQQIGKNIVGYVGTRPDALLERQVGSRVVVEIVEDDVIFERVGLLKEYSAHFLELWDVLYPQTHSVPLTAASSAADLQVIAEGQTLRIRNPGTHPVLLEQLHMGGEKRELHALVEPQEEITLHLNGPLAGARLTFQAVRLLDVIVPRSHALVRHRVVADDPAALFDIGIALRITPAEEAQEEELRRRLRQNPQDALAAASLGRLLYRRGELAEAEQYLSHALKLHRFLPDGGKRVQQELHLVRKRQSERK